MSEAASEAGKALSGHRWAKKTKAERLAIGRKLTDARIQKRKKARKKKGE
jgi:hypothetical protein